jgi:hypothetical protein
MARFLSHRFCGQRDPHMQLRIVGLCLATGWLAYVSLDERPNNHSSRCLDSNMGCFRMVGSDLGIASYTQHRTNIPH